MEKKKTFLVSGSLFSAPDPKLLALDQSPTSPFSSWSEVAAARGAFIPFNHITPPFPLLWSILSHRESSFPLQFQSNPNPSHPLFLITFNQKTPLPCTYLPLLPYLYFYLYLYLSTSAFTCLPLLFPPLSKTPTSILSYPLPPRPKNSETPKNPKLLTRRRRRRRRRRSIASSQRIHTHRRIKKNEANASIIFLLSHFSS